MPSAIIIACAALAALTPAIAIAQAPVICDGDKPPVHISYEFSAEDRRYSHHFTLCPEAGDSKAQFLTKVKLLRDRSVSRTRHPAQRTAMMKAFNAYIDQNKER